MGIAKQGVVINDDVHTRRRPDTLTILGAVVIALAATQLILGALSVGVTADEPWHVYRTQNLIDHGWYVIGVSSGEPLGGALSSQYVYGPGFSMPAHLLAVATGVESGGNATEGAGAYEFRHLMVALICLLTALGVWASVRLLTGSNPSAVWSAAALLCIPVWLGMGMFNIKDVPVAAGYTLFTTGLLLSMSARVPSRRSYLIAIVALCAAGVILSFGVRFGMWVAIAASLGLWLVLVIARRNSDRRVPGRAFAAVAAGTLLGAGVMVALYPMVFAGPLSLLVESVTISGDYPFDGSTLTAGTQQSTRDPALWYLPVWIFAVVPVLIFLLAVYGAGAWLWRSTASLRGSGLGRFLSGDRAPVLLVALQLLLLPAAAIILNSTMYSGMRQHLYVIPALAVFAGLGLSQARDARWLDTTGNAWRRRALVVFASLALLLPLIEQARLFPFNYTYINPVAGLGGVQKNWSTEYWWASNREAAQEAPAGRPVLCPGDLMLLSFSECPQHTAAFLGEGTPRFDPRRPGTQPVAVVVFAIDPKFVPDFCQDPSRVTRPIRTEQLTLARILTCDPKSVAKRYNDLDLYTRTRLKESGR